MLRVNPAALEAARRGHEQDADALVRVGRDLTAALEQIGRSSGHAAISAAVLIAQDELARAIGHGSDLHGRLSARLATSALRYADAEREAAGHD